MQQLHYAALAEHKADHEPLLDVLLEIMESVEAPADYGRATLGRRLDNWFTVHFRTHDARLHSWLAGRG